jgi:deoxyribose-phosphate aldolase
VNPVDRTALAQAIDHTLLCPTATHAQIETLCQEARDHGFYSVCVGPRWVNLASDLLQDCPTKTTTVIGFPLGFETTHVKTQQAKDAIFNGADEIDMVADLGAIMEQDSRLLTQQCQGALKACRHMRPAVTLKVILECAALTHDQKLLASGLAEQVGVDFIQTSTGFQASGGATARWRRLKEINSLDVPNRHDLDEGHAGHGRSRRNGRDPTIPCSANHRVRRIRLGQV